MTMAIASGRGYVLDKVDGKFCIVEAKTRRVVFNLAQVDATATFEQDNAGRVTVTFVIEVD
jgi:hypothetical protein